MNSRRVTAAFAVGLLLAAGVAWAGPPPGAAGPVTPVVIKQYSNGAPISTDEPLAVNCVTGCAGGGGGGSDAVVQGANTSGQSGVLIQGAVTTAAPTYTTAKTNPLSLTTTGGLRVDGSGVTQPVSDGGGSLTVDGTVAATQSGTWNVTNISGTVSLPTGAATASNQTTGNSSLASILTAVQAATPASENYVGRVGGTTVTPTSVLTRPANTTAYSQNDLLANNVTAGSIAATSFTAARVSGGSGVIIRARLVTNATTGWDAVTVRVRFWSVAPTWTNGDNGAYAVATGSAGYLGRMDMTLEQLGDGAVGNGAPGTGTAIAFDLASGTALYWDLQITSAAGATPISGQTFTLIPEILQD